MIDNDTICAISTASGIGGIAIIRVSGDNAINICDKIFKSKKKISLKESKEYSLTYGSIYDNENNIIDEVLIGVFRSPHSFTGEDIVEVSCHGSIFIQQKILELLTDNGCRIAMPGEFTQRAFLNGKMDLSQAEAIADLINSTAKTAHRVAMNQMRGGFSEKLKLIREKLIDFASLIELELDFSEEDVEFADRESLIEVISEIKEHITKLYKSFKVGNVIKNGIPVAIVGETNVGKSTLLNTLLNEEKAIVSNIHGTTRDSIEDIMIIDGITFRFIDTAGIRETSDDIETIGIQKTFDKIEKADIILWLIDANASKQQAEDTIKMIEHHCKDKNVIVVINKSDITKENSNLDKIIEQNNHIFISAKHKHNIEELKNKIIDITNIPEIGENDVVVTNVRHINALQNALIAIDRIEEGIQSLIPSDLLTQDIRDCIYHIGEITGEISNDEVLHNIFAKFCIGK